ncbi:hypothetical protein [Sphingomonas sp.]|uniref:hypothetical protein n=1 Tax=Sphingomonas sp. TaxID=28214 RepID=UPI0035AFCA4D
MARVPAWRMGPPAGIAMRQRGAMSIVPVARNPTDRTGAHARATHAHSYFHLYARAYPNPAIECMREGSESRVHRITASDINIG